MGRPEVIPVTISTKDLIVIASQAIKKQEYHELESGRAMRLVVATAQRRRGVRFPRDEYHDLGMITLASPIAVSVTLSGESSASFSPCSASVIAKRQEIVAINAVISKIDDRNERKKQVARREKLTRKIHKRLANLSRRFVMRSPYRDLLLANNIDPRTVTGVRLRTC